MPNGVTKCDLHEEGRAMNCGLFNSEMYAWRRGDDPISFKPLFECVAARTECAQAFEQLTAAHQGVQRAFQRLSRDEIPAYSAAKPAVCG